MSNLPVRKEQPTTVAHTDPMDRWVRNFFGWDPFRELAPLQAMDRSFMPAFEIKETKEGYLFKADLPGVKENDLEVTVTGNRLTRGGEEDRERHLLLLRAQLRQLHALVHAARRLRRNEGARRAQRRRDDAPRPEDAGSAAQEDRDEEVIKKVGRAWVLYTSDGARVLGKHKTRAAAVRQERAINISKARAAGHRIPRRPARRKR
jgi:HSP20 family molecular chaperone IbpA